MRAKISGLTPCQFKTAQLLACGLSHKEIANVLQRSASTVSNTLRTLYEKLQLNKESEVVAYILCKFYGASLDFDKIGKISRAVGATMLLMLMSIQIAMLDSNTMMRSSRRSGRRGENEFEIVCFTDNEEE